MSALRAFLAGKDSGIQDGPLRLVARLLERTLSSLPVDLPSLSGIKFPSCQRTRAASDSRQQGVKMGQASKAPGLGAKPLGL